MLFETYVLKLNFKTEIKNLVLNFKEKSFGYATLL